MTAAAYTVSKVYIKRKFMNCCLWIILLLACRGNGGFGCGNNGGNNQCGKSWCGCMEHTHYDCGCMNHGYDDCGCAHHDHDGCGCTHYDHDDCGCMNHMYDDCGCAHNDDDCGCNDNHMEYETYGCQENGIPCPPPVPGNYMR